MLRQAVQTHLDHEPDFAWRGQSVTRIENLSDIVFALALGMLVSASSPPQTFSDLGAFLFSIIPVAAGFAILLLVWNDHFTFFRRYGLGDGTTVFLNAALLLVVLYIAYPLRFAFDSFFGFVLLMLGDPSRVSSMQVGFRESGIIMGYFAGGYSVLNALMGLMYGHALRRKDALDLSPVEIVLTRQAVANLFIGAAISVTVGLLAVFTELNGFAGGFLWLLAFSHLLVNRVIARPVDEAGG